MRQEIEMVQSSNTQVCLYSVLSLKSEPNCIEQVPRHLWIWFLNWKLKGLHPAQQTIIQSFSVSVVLWQRTLLAVLDYSKREYTASGQCTTALNRYLPAALLSSVKGSLDGVRKWNSASSSKEFLKSCLVTLKKVFLYNLTTLSQLYKVTNRHSQSAPRNLSVLLSYSAPAVPHRILMQNNKPGLRF